MTTTKLPDMEFKFDINVKGNDTATVFEGHFRYRRPSLGARARIASTNARLNGDVENLKNLEIEELNYALAHLRHTLMDTPAWWEEAFYGMELYDSNVIEEVYNKCMKFEAEWKARIHSDKKTDVMESKDATTEAFVRIPDEGQTKV